jgi:hypothetical protein
MNQETNICQTCRREFVIEPDDLDFYERIKVPLPTFCWECRLMRRLAHRNERSLYRRKCDLCKKDIVARFPADAVFPVYCVSCWYSDNWAPTDYGRDYDFSRIFFDQFGELQKVVPKPAVFNVNPVNSDYANQCVDVKNVYLSASIIKSEDIYYSSVVDDSRDSFDIAYGQHIERCGHSIDLVSCTEVFHSRYAKSSLNGTFLYDVRNSHDCFACVNIRNGKHRIFNIQYDPEEYRKKIEQYDIGSYKKFLEVKKNFEEFTLRFPRRYAMLDKCVGVTGDNVQNARESKQAFDSYDLENSRYLFRAVQGVKDSLDLNHSGILAELCYESCSCIGNQNFFSYGSYGRNMEYCELTNNKAASNLFGCISINKKKDYCILNRQYEKQEYEDLVRRIKEQMKAMPYTDSKGRIYRYGEFFPIDLSPFAYNETLAQEIFPLTQAEAEQRGYRWRITEKKPHEPTMSHADIPDHIKDVSDSILKEIISCEHGEKCADGCVGAFRILPQELNFYKKFNFPLPRLCPNCRHYERLKQRNPLKLWKRKCQCSGQKSENGAYQNTIKHPHEEGKCPNEFETSYSPERKEIVYCESCYNSEVV